MLSADFGKWADILQQIEKEDLYINPSEEIYGYEIEPHVTILYGFHENIKHQSLNNIIKKYKPLTLQLKGVSAFKGEKYDVLKIEVFNPKLQMYRKQITKFEHTDTYPEYVPHITIAYLKQGASDKYTKNLFPNLYVKSTKVKYSVPNGTEYIFDLKN